MRLEKWYADRVSGNAVEIEYLARLQLGPLIVSYSGEVGRGRRSRVRIGRTGIAMPCVENGRLYWHRDGVNQPWTWRNAHQRPITLWRDARNSVVWNPVVLNGQTTESDPNRPGRGYAEVLTLDIAPWRLGIDALKWGRFCGERHSLVWIEWQGRFPRKLALLDGEEQVLISADRTDICTAHARLRIADLREIVQEPLGAGALQALGPLRGIATGRFLSGVETKWLASGELECEGDAIDHGSVVFEEVIWQ
ncbi:MAG: hypothetical protein HZA64_04170 [Rhodocyclales bacterium]|nr:hypothetical protein [Rhodocyclales bacterium]